MTEIVIYSLCVLYIILVVISIYNIYKSYKKYQCLKSYYPIKLRTIENNVLQYSIDGNEWNDIIAFDDKAKYIDKTGKIYETPGFVRMRIRDDQTANDWKGCLGSLQKVHEWNTKAFHHYKDAIYEYLDMNNEDKQ